MNISFADILFTLIRCSFIESFFFPGKRGKNSLKVIFLVWKLDILFLQVCYKVLSIGPFLWRDSTETALIRLTDQILTNIDNDELTGLVFIDFRKAFDVIDHELLLKNLSMYSVRPSSVTWFKSYLSERKHFIALGKVKSEQLTGKARCASRVNFRSGAFRFVNQRYSFLCSQINYGHLCRWFHLVLKFRLENISALNQSLSDDLVEIERWARGNKLYINTQASMESYRPRFRKAGSWNEYRWNWASRKS